MNTLNKNREEPPKPPQSRSLPRLNLSSVIAIVGLGLGLCAPPARAEAAGSAQAQGQSAASGRFEQLARRAQAAMNSNQIPEAIRLYSQATALRPTWSEGWWCLGGMNFDAGRYIQARDAFLHFVAVEHRSPGPGYGMLGLTEVQLKDYRKALQDLEHGVAAGLGADPNFVHDALYEDGILNNLFGKPDIALARLTMIAVQMAHAHPDAPEKAVLADDKLLDAFGLAALRIHQLPSEIPTEKAGLIRLAGNAQALVALQDLDAAGDQMKELVALYPDEPGVHYMYGVFLLKAHPPLAAAQFRRELEVSPSSVAARIQLAFNSLQDAQYKEGLKYAQEAVKLAPGNFVAHVVCGRLLLQMGNTGSALEELRTAVKLSPGSPDAHFALSRALLAAGQKTAAAHERAEFERLKALSNAGNRQ